ncbi:hypothetical protein KY314_00330 [Candidatus Woesearchaeota archaeon]|nr:hypothetical protein [Candidatus Woesearchaeota archaeon]
MDKKEEKKDVLEEIKKLEELKRKAILLQLISNVKKYAKEILVLKKTCEVILTEADIEEKDIKRIIDFLNNLPDVQLSKEDIKEIREKIKKDIKEKKKKITEKTEKKIEEGVISNNGVTGLTSNTLGYYSSEDDSNLYLNTNGMTSNLGINGTSIKFQTTKNQE